MDQINIENKQIKNNESEKLEKKLKRKEYMKEYREKNKEKIKNYECNKYNEKQNERYKKCAKKNAQILKLIKQAYSSDSLVITNNIIFDELKTLLK